MKKRRTAIVAFLLCAVLCLAVGYAALTDTLYLNGTVSADNKGAIGPDGPKIPETFNANVYFSDPSDTNIVTITADSDGNDKDLAEITIPTTTWEAAPQTVTYTVDVFNDNDTVDVTVKLNDVFETGDDFNYFTCNVEWSKGVILDENDSAIIKSGEKATVTISVTLEKMPTEDNPVTASFETTFEVTSINNNVA